MCFVGVLNIAGEFAELGEVEAGPTVEAGRGGAAGAGGGVARLPVHRLQVDRQVAGLGECTAAQTAGVAGRGCGPGRRGRQKQGGRGGRGGDWGAPGLLGNRASCQHNILQTDKVRKVCLFLLHEREKLEEKQKKKYKTFYFKLNTEVQMIIEH